MESMQDIVEMGQKYVMNTYARFPYAFTRGEGVYLYDMDGKKHLDFVSGIAVNSLGYGNEALIGNLEEQMHKVFHTSNLYWIEPQVKLAKALVERSCFDKAFFCNSGAEATESALKLARKYGNLVGGEEKCEIITMKNSFHGRTYGSITATGQTKYQKGLGPMLPGIRYAEFNNIDSVRAIASKEHTCGVLVEPVQGEGGVIPADPGFMKELRELCSQLDILMMVDEVQTGIGRTGKLFGYQNYGIEPDVMALAKGLGGGVPIGAMLAKDFCAKAFQPGDHASTFGGNFLSATAGLTVLSEIDRLDLTENARIQGEYLQEAARKLQSKYDFITEVRGLGLMQGIILKDAQLVGQIRLEAAKRGLLVIGAGYTALRIVPPLIIQREEIEEGLRILDEAMAEVTKKNE